MIMKFKDIKLPSNKKFGLFFSLVFLFFFLYFYDGDFKEFDVFLLIISFLLLIISVLIPKILSPLNKSWMFLGFIIGKIVSPLVLGVIFFGLLTPVALFTKLIGRDELNLVNKNQVSFWKSKEKIKDYKRFFYNQF